jgi:hypothetical protein
MLHTFLLSSIAKQLMGSGAFEVQGKRLPVRRTSKQSFRTVTFAMRGRQYAAIEQNPDKPSRWGQVARGGHRVEQFKDAQANKFVGVEQRKAFAVHEVLAGKVANQGGLARSGLPDDVHVGAAVGAPDSEATPQVAEVSCGEFRDTIFFWLGSHPGHKFRVSVSARQGRRAM